MLGEGKDVSCFEDITPYSIGIKVYVPETGQNEMDIIIKSNEHLPCEKTIPYYTYINDQTKIEIEVLQGEGIRADECPTITKLTINGIAKRPAGKNGVNVKFSIGLDDML